MPARRRMTSCSVRQGQGWSWKTWPGWPGRCSSARGRTSPTPIPVTMTAGLVPERAGQAVNVLAYMSLADLLLIEGSSALLEEWASGLRARWARHRAAAEEAGGHQGLWLDGDAAQALACGASITPVVVGD